MRLAVISGCQTARTLHTGAFSDLARELPMKKTHNALKRKLIVAPLETAD